MPSTTVVTSNSFTRNVVLFFCLATLQLPPIQSTLSKDGVEKYVITRRNRTDSDVFKVFYKTSHKCPEDVCENSSAWVNNAASCSCSCKANTATFLPQLGNCGDIASIKKSLFGNCSQALGLESGKIIDSQLTSPDALQGFSPSEGRLNNDKAWCAFGKVQFFEIDLLKVRHVSALATQGYQGHFNNYVKTFEIKYSYDGATWSDYQDENKRKKEFTGNSDTDTIKYNYFKQTFETRFLRIYPKVQNRFGYGCLRVEVYGCSDNTVFAVCSSFFEWPFSVESLDLANAGEVDIGSNNSYQACQVITGSTAYYDYQLENNWARAYPEIFKIERAHGKLIFKWTNGADKNLLGRIVRIMINCSHSVSTPRPPKTACLIFKSSRQITFGNPVVEIQMERPIEDVSVSGEQDGQSTYQGLVTNNGQSNGGADPSEGYYGYCSLYQSVNKNTPVTAVPVYQNVHTPETAPDYQNVQTTVTALDYQNMQVLEGGVPYASMHSLGYQTVSE